MYEISRVKWHLNVFCSLPMCQNSIFLDIRKTNKIGSTLFCGPRQHFKNAPKKIELKTVNINEMELQNIFKVVFSANHKTVVFSTWQKMAQNWISHLSLSHQTGNSTTSLRTWRCGTAQIWIWLVEQFAKSLIMSLPRFAQGMNGSTHTKCWKFHMRHLLASLVMLHLSFFTNHSFVNIVLVGDGGRLIEHFMMTFASYSIRRDWTSVMNQWNKFKDVRQDAARCVESTRVAFHYFLLNGLAARGSSVTRQLFFTTLLLAHKDLSRTGIEATSHMNLTLSPRTYDAELLIHLRQYDAKLRWLVVTHVWWHLI